MTVYSVRMASGDTFSWTGDPITGEGWDTACGFLILSGGTLLRLEQIESMTPVGTAGLGTEVSR